MFISGLVVTADHWSQPKCPSFGEEEINHGAKEYYTAGKKNEGGLNVLRWIGLQDTLLAEKKQVAEYYGQYNTEIKILNAQK